MTQEHTTPIAGGVRLQVQKLTKQYGKRTVLHEAGLAIEPGQFVAIVGRSGCGKSTLLRLVEIGRASCRERVYI